MKQAVQLNEKETLADYHKNRKTLEYDKTLHFPVI